MMRLEPTHVMSVQIKRESKIRSHSVLFPLGQAGLGSVETVLVRVKRFALARQVQMCVFIILAS